MPERRECVTSVYQLTDDEIMYARSTMNSLGLGVIDAVGIATGRSLNVPDREGFVNGYHERIKRLLEEGKIK